ncbi:uncharacterized protein LOC127858136 [Dreissena polymorpha]|uniref:Protein kinase domain-containing protein n=1 Tax=Dreissena polymorpha TaxID=45954 RepID=A0A9D4S5S8_DREPO|nr:uncharacterized protein LOC127858136 [Dreissena polymorpha]KAH3892636.1 hypothetical protein DPMN_016759 [Dreissena polymorpha]
MSAKRDPSWYIQSKENAFQIPDLKTAFDVFKLIDFNAKGMGIKTKDDAVRVIIEKLDKGVDPEKKQPSKGLKKAIEDDQKHKAKLVDKYERSQKLYNELPSNYKRDLRQVFPGIEEAFETRKAEIKKSECTILIVGETAAGKSSLINLLLGESLLPSSQLGCTSTIVEIRSSREPNRRTATGFFRSYTEQGQPKKAPPPVMFDLTSQVGGDQFRRAVAETDEDGLSPYDRIEVTWPFAMLEEGIVIVDTPGIGGGSKVGKHVERYLSKSYGFIYVVNSANAGGVQKGRLQTFMRMVVNAAGAEGYNSESTMVVCNRWDMVPGSDREAVKQDTFEKLSRFFTDLKQSQIHYMSIMEAMKAVSMKTNYADLDRLQTMVERLLPDSLRSRLNAHYRWLSAVLKRIIYTLKVSKVMAAKSVETIKDELHQVKVQIEKLEQNAKDSINYLKSGINAESDLVSQKVVQFLQSRDLAARLFSWRADELPNDDKKKVAGDAMDRIANKLAHEIGAWEREHNLVTGIKDKIIRVCKRDFELMEEQIAKIEGALLGGDGKIVRDLHQSVKGPSPIKQSWLKSKGKGSEDDVSTYKGLGGMVAGVGSLKSGDKAFKKIFADYKLKYTDKCIAIMQSATKAFLESILQSKSLQEKMLKFFSRFVKDIDAVAKMIPDFLKADLELMQDLQKEMADKQVHLREMFPKLLNDSHTLLGQCDIFYVNHIMQFDYDLSDLIWDRQTRPVGSGSFADVYIASCRSERHGVFPVALKVCRDPLKESTVSDILLEDRTMRELDHPNIVRYYGATYTFRHAQQKRDMQWIMIMEVCNYTLKDKFISPEVSNPGKLALGSTAQLDAMVVMADFALQLGKGVFYLHQKGFVHRDLKLENILVTENNIVKLTDVGLTKQTSDIAQSIVGSPVYMAPEVLTQEQNYDHKADVYSIAIMLWEMWYGRDAADYIQQQLFGPLEKAIKDGLRPSLKMTTKPPEPWYELIERSWAYKPEDRPSVDTHCKFFEGFIRDARRM